MKTHATTHCSRNRFHLFALAAALMWGLALSPSAAFAGNEKGPRCNDGIDNDGDGLIDCADSDCNCGDGDTSGNSDIPLASALDNRVGDLFRHDLFSDVDGTLVPIAYVHKVDHVLNWQGERGGMRMDTWDHRRAERSAYIDPSVMDLSGVAAVDFPDLGDDPFRRINARFLFGDADRVGLVLRDIPVGAYDIVGMTVRFGADNADYVVRYGFGPNEVVSENHPDPATAVEVTRLSETEWLAVGTVGTLFILDSPNSPLRALKADVNAPFALYMTDQLP